MSDRIKDHVLNVLRCAGTKRRALRVETARAAALPCRDYGSAFGAAFRALLEGGTPAQMARQIADTVASERTVGL